MDLRDLRNLGIPDIGLMAERLGKQFIKYYGGSYSSLIARPPLPSDFGKPSWVWQANETIHIRNNCIVGLTGIWSPVLIQVQIIRDEKVRAIFVPWQENTYTVLGTPSQRFIIRPTPLNGRESKAFYFAFRGVVVEPEGMYISAGTPRNDI